MTDGPDKLLLSCLGRLLDADRKNRPESGAADQSGCSVSPARGWPWYTFSSAPEVPAMMGLALAFVRLALP